MKFLIMILLVTGCLMPLWSADADGKLVPNQLTEDLWSPVKNVVDKNHTLCRRSGSFGLNEYRVFMYSPLSTINGESPDKYTKIEIYRDVELLFAAVRQNGVLTIEKYHADFWAKVTKENASQLLIDNDYLVVGRKDKTFVCAGVCAPANRVELCTGIASAELFAKYCGK